MSRKHNTKHQRSSSSYPQKTGGATMKMADHKLSDGKAASKNRS